MKAAARREEILALLSAAQSPVSANALRAKVGVSRQVIVQDIALLRTGGYEITATSRGYLLSQRKKATRVLKCRHTMQEVAEECLLIIEAGGKIEDVFVHHRLYGRLSARLDLENRVQVEELCRSLASGASKPLMSVTDGFHYHTVTSASEEILDEIEGKLRKRGFLVES